MTKRTKKASDALFSRPAMGLTTTGMKQSSYSTIRDEFKDDACFRELAYPENLDAPLFMATGSGISYNGEALPGIWPIDGRL